MGQSSLNASHDVFIGRPGKIDPSSYLSEVHSFSSALSHERTCRAKLTLDPELALDPRIVPSPGLATARLAICADAEGGYLPLAGSKARARQRG